MNCAVNENTPAVIDKEHRVSIGYETYFVSSETAKFRLMKNVPRYCGILTDPVTKERFYPSKKSPHQFHRDREYFFKSDSTQQVFAMMPMDFEDPAYKMIPKTDTLSTQVN